jgi:hypothetical protein
MMQKYDIFKKSTDNVFIWIETVENITAGKKRLTSLASSRPGDYRLWDISRHEFVDRLYLEIRLREIPACLWTEQKYFRRPRSS